MQTTKEMIQTKTTKRVVSALRRTRLAVKVGLRRPKLCLKLSTRSSRSDAVAHPDIPSLTV
jgi:hypothetical protein